MGEKWAAAVAPVKRLLGNWMDDTGTNKADIADVVVPVVAAAMALVSGVLIEISPLDEGWDSLKRVETIVALVSSVATAVVTGVAAKRSLSTRKDARGAISSFSNSLTGAADAVDGLMKSERTLADRDRFIDAMLLQATSLMPISQCRATLYSLEEAENDGSVDDFYLKIVGRSKGRPDKARAQFQPDTEHGAAIISIVRNGQSRFVSDHRNCDFPVERDKEAMWRSFCVVPVGTPGRVWGALFLDADKKTEFTSDKKAVAMSIARFVEIGIELLASAAADVQPEFDEARKQLDGVAPATVGRASYTPSKKAGD
ncbi:GAF domain-containing protein [Microbacterium sp. BH-3-3-3]|uniref:GAF domain-containing protein n=1 Tax=Microbacterium sp. BH-3-3-3 TaxID=1906742 RepID=UPI0012EA3478|nr:GAF domain-containing protein [Microbacterium sp. BH-3-3-3]